MRPVPVFPDYLVKLVIPASRAILKPAVIYRFVSLIYSSGRTRIWRRFRVFCLLSVKVYSLVQNLFKNRNPCRCPVCIYSVSTRNSIWTCDSVVRRIFRAQDDDVQCTH